MGNLKPGSFINLLEIPSSNKLKFTPEGGMILKLTNKTGSASVKGTIVMISTGTDNAFMTATVSTDMPIGAVYESGVADGAECWIVIKGIAEILLKDSTASTRGNWTQVSTTAGRLDATAAYPNAATHWSEMGHCMESKAAGTNILCKVLLHFN